MEAQNLWIFSLRETADSALRIKKEKTADTVVHNWTAEENTSNNIASKIKNILSISLW